MLLSFAFVKIQTYVNFWAFFMLHQSLLQCLWVMSYRDKKLGKSYSFSFNGMQLNNFANIYTFCPIMKEQIMHASGKGVRRLCKKPFDFLPNSTHQIGFWRSLIPLLIFFRKFSDKTEQQLELFSLITKLLIFRKFWCVKQRHLYRNIIAIVKWNWQWKERTI